MDSKRSRLCWDHLGGSRPHLPRFDPQLPRALWERFRKDYPDSIIFHAFFSDVRHQILVIKLNSISMEFPENPLAFDDFFPPILMAVPSSKKTAKPTLNGTMGGSWLHLAVTQADLPLAHECIRLGTPIEHKDRRGYSALYFACSVVSNFFLPNGAVAVLINLPPGSTRRKDLANDFLSQLIAIIQLFLEHHADPNETHDGMSLLGLACLAEQWELIQALLLHGAHASPSSLAPAQLPERFLKTQRDRSTFDSYVTKFSGHPRPLRRCPCGSGRALEDCHLETQTYPEEGICPCGAGKICGKCCYKRKAMMHWVEMWDARGARLRRLCISRLAQADPEVVKSKEEQYIKEQNSTGKGVRSFTDFSHTVTRELAEEGKLDPAYAAAGLKVHFTPLRPRGARSMSKMELAEAIRLWNAAVDEYIASGVDSRATETIENAAKVGPAGGPLHRKCEATGCPNIEYRNDVKISVCSGCSKAAYCSRTCQKHAWRAHRSACRAGTARVQLLPSQEVYSKQLALGWPLQMGIDKDDPNLAELQEMIASAWAY